MAKCNKCDVRYPDYIIGETCEIYAGFEAECEKCDFTWSDEESEGCPDHGMTNYSYISIKCGGEIVPDE